MAPHPRRGGTTRVAVASTSAVPVANSFEGSATFSGLFEVSGIVSIRRWLSVALDTRAGDGFDCGSVAMVVERVRDLVHGRRILNGGGNRERLAVGDHLGFRPFNPGNTRKPSGTCP